MFLASPPRVQDCDNPKKQYCFLGRKIYSQRSARCSGNGITPAYGLASQSGVGVHFDDKISRCRDSSPDKRLDPSETLSDIKRLTTYVASVINNWPKYFISLIQQYNLRYSDLKGNSKTLTFWYENIIQQGSFKVQQNPIFRSSPYISHLASN